MTQDTTSNVTRGVHHIGLTVPNVNETSAFFVDVLGYKRVGERPEYPAVFVFDGTTTITLWQVSDPDAAVEFDRRNVVGLHHLAIAVESSAALDSLFDRVRTTRGVTIEFSPEQQGSGNNRHMMCNIPGGIRVEFIAPKQ